MKFRLQSSCVPCTSRGKPRHFPDVNSQKEGPQPAASSVMPLLTESTELQYVNNSTLAMIVRNFGQLGGYLAAVELSAVFLEIRGEGRRKADRGNKQTKHGETVSVLIVTNTKWSRDSTAEGWLERSTWTQCNKGSCLVIPSNRPPA